jgi:hypothetical protein
MDRLQAMKVFTRVVETSNFTRAADALDLPRASVSIIIPHARPRRAMSARRRNYCV